MRKHVLTFAILAFSINSFAADFGKKELAEAYSKLKTAASDNSATANLENLELVKSLAVKSESTLTIATDTFILLQSKMNDDYETRIIIRAILVSKSETPKVDLIHDASDLYTELDPKSLYTNDVMGDVFPIILKAAESVESIELALTSFLDIANVEVRTLNGWTSNYDMETTEHDTKASVDRALTAYKSIFGIE